jgi:chromosome segregation ATPase
MRHEHE